MRDMNLTYKVIIDQKSTQLHLDGLGTSSYKSKINLIHVLNSSCVMTHRFLGIFKLLIFTLFDF
jgi:hypothetical protein